MMICHYHKTSAMIDSKTYLKYGYYRFGYTFGLTGLHWNYFGVMQL